MAESIRMVAPSGTKVRVEAEKVDQYKRHGFRLPAGRPPASAPAKPASKVKK